MSRMWLWAFGLLVVAGVVSAPAQRNKPAAGERARREWVEKTGGEFDMSQNPRPFVVFLALDQQDNINPSFWCGRNLEGVTRFTPTVDFLDGSLVINHVGAFTLQITHAAHKYGMEDKIPGGNLIHDVRARDFRIEVERIEDPVLKDIRKSSIVTGRGLTADSNLITYTVTVSGIARVGERGTPFRGAGTLGFFDATPAFILNAEFTLSLEALGLTGGNGKPVTARLFTMSSPKTTVPALGDEADLLPAGL